MQWGAEEELRNMGTEEGHVLDGGTLGGGGLLVRNAVAFSALLGEALRIVSIRSKRTRRGLRMQHVRGIQLVQDLCSGELVGGEVSSTELSLLPGPLKPAGLFLSVDVGTAGSLSLIILAALPVLLFQPPFDVETAEVQTTTISLKGGTNCATAPQIDYLIHVFIPMAERKFGLRNVSASLIRRGYYPQGGGEVMLKVTPFSPGESLTATDSTERGNVTRIHGYIFVDGVLPISIAWDMRNQVMESLEKAGYGRRLFPTLENDLQVVKESGGLGSGIGLLLWAETETGCILAGSAVQERLTKPQDIATDASNELIRNLNMGGCVDEHMQDQVIILMALAKGRSRVRTGPLTLHAETAIWVAREMAGVVFSVAKLDGDQYLLECEGLGQSVCSVVK